MATEHEQLKHAIAALEAQRAILGDAVVDAALAPMREKLAELEKQSEPAEPQRKQVTVLFADVSGFTAMSETLDAEEVTEIMNALWARLDTAITAQGGMIDKHIGDCVMALWGVKRSREDDPERAIHAALAMQAELAEFRATRQLPLAMRIGLHTGLALLGEVGSTHEFTAMGDTVNLASRLEHAAPVGGILISHATYGHVRGVFDVLTQEPLSVKGKVEPVQTYVVQRAIPRALRKRARGVEGVETRMIGRVAEFARLQEAYFATVEDHEFQMVTVTGAAGVGKSRLLYEFQTWAAAPPRQREPLQYAKASFGTPQPCPFELLQCRANPETQAMPYALLRDLFSLRFQIHDSDPLEVVQTKIAQGLTTAAPSDQIVTTAAWPAAQTAMRAQFIGYLLGFDFNAANSPHLKEVLSDASLVRDRALRYIADYFEMLTASLPVVLCFEDLHWSDDSSLDALNHLADVWARGNYRVLIIGAARPELLERRPHWGEGQPYHTKLALRALSKSESRRLVDEILQKVETIPDALRELVVSNAEGNPFYVEELLKMFAEDGVIVRGAERWTVNPARLAEVRVPPTLVALLQARFDRLPAPEQEVLQCASVVGRTFWDAAVSYLDGAELSAVEDISTVLTALRQQEMISQRENCTFSNAREYIFKQALVHSATYESVLKRARRAYHARAAEWLIAHSGARASEFAGLIAEHLERAGQAERAAGYLQQAGAKALATSAYREALSFSRRALNLLPETSPERTMLLIQVGETLSRLGDYELARQHLEQGLARAEQAGDTGSCVDALNHLSRIAIEQGDWQRARTHLEKSLPLARELADQSRIGYTLLVLSWVDSRQGKHDEAQAHLTENQAIYEALGDRLGLGRVFAGLGSVAVALEQYEQAQERFLRSLTLFRETGYRQGEAAVLNNIGEAARLQGDYATARSYYQEALGIARETGVPLNIGSILRNLAHTVGAAGDYAAAMAYYHEALQITAGIGATPATLESLAGLAEILTHTEQADRALALLGLIANHPALQDDTRQEFVAPIMANLRAQLSPAELAAGLARGQGLELDAIVAEMLAQKPD